MDTRTKLRAFNALLGSQYLKADLAILKEMDPSNEVLKMTTVPERKHREAIMALLDVFTEEEIREARNEYLEELAEAEKRKSEELVKQELIGFLNEHEVEFPEDATVEDLEKLKKAKEEDLKQAQKATEEKEAAAIKKFLDDKGVKYHPKLGLKKLRKLKKETLASEGAKDPEKPESTKQEKPVEEEKEEEKKS